MPNNKAFADLDRVLTRWFYHPNLESIHITLAAVQTHYLPIGDPTWLFTIAPPGSGKTTQAVLGAANLPNVKMLSDFSENTFLSGMYHADRPGILEKFGTVECPSKDKYIFRGDGLLVCKDFTTVLAMQDEKRGKILGQLREIHDGTFHRDFGTGESKTWTGKVTVIAAVTPAVDRYTSIFATLGERFVSVRFPRPDSEESGTWAINQQGHEEEIRQQLQSAVSILFKNAIKEIPRIPGEMIQQIASLAEIVAFARTHVVHEQYTREPLYIPEPEANTRLSKQLAGLARGMASLNRRFEVSSEDLKIAEKVGLDCIPNIRRAVLLAGNGSDKPETPKSSIKLAREDLQVLGVLEPCEPDKVTYNLTPRFDRLFRQAGLR